MKTLQSHIDEALYSKKGINPENATDIAEMQVALEKLKMYTTKNTNRGYHWVGTNKELFDEGCIKATRNGIEIYNHDKEAYVIVDFQKTKFPDFNISKVEGDIVIDTCGRITSLEGLFTQDCEIGGEIFILHNKKLKSLKGIPQKYGPGANLLITYNDNLDDIEGLPKNCPVIEWRMNKFQSDDFDESDAVLNRMIAHMQKWDYLCVNHVEVGKMPEQCKRNG